MEASLATLEHGEERLLGNLHPADLLHASLPLFLLLEQLPLAGDVAAVALRGDVLAHRLDGLAGDHLRTDRRLDGDLEHLPWDQLAEPRAEIAAADVGVVAVDDDGHRVDGVA